MAETPARKAQKPIWYVVGCIGLVILSVPCIGVLAAIAIPAFVNYARRAKTAEARANVTMIAHGVQAYCGENGALPAAIAPTLASPGAARQIVSLDAAWASIGFAPTDPLYYAYSIERPDGARALVVAEGDLDSDGSRSRFEVTCTAAGAGCSCGELMVTSELE